MLNNYKIYGLLILLLFAGMFGEKTFAQTDSLKMKRNISTSDSLFTNTDTLKTDSTTSKSVKDTLLLGFSSYAVGEEENYIFPKEKLYKKNYRYTGDWLTYVPFGFKQELGSYGQPHEIMLYGLGFGNVEYISDGISLNNQMLNAFDLNLYQSEFIDSLIALPLTRGFLYSGMNNPAAVQFITRKKNYDAPYSRIRFVQGPNKEGLLDVNFNSKIGKKFFLSGDLTNGAVDVFYPNADFGGWKVSSKLSYLLSDKINVIGGYRYYKTYAGLNGGVDIEKIQETYAPELVNEILYNEFEAPVRYGEFYSDSPRYQKTTGHNFNLSLLANFFEGSRTEINSYYNFNEVKFRQNERNKYSYIPEIFNDNKSYSTGINLRQEISINFLRTEVLASYSREKFISPLLNHEIAEYDVFSLGGSASAFLFDSVFVPTGFIKYLNSYGESFSGAGGNAEFRFNYGFSLTAGYSSFEKPYSVLEREMMKDASAKTSAQIYEGGVSFSKKNLFISLKYFNSSFFNAAVPVVDDSDPLRADQIVFYSTENYGQRGVNLSGEALLNFIKVSVNASYYFKPNSDTAPRVPDFSLFAGVYYVDTLFNDNLQLKAGAEIRLSGGQQYFIYDYQHGRQVFYQYSSATNKISFIKNEETDFHYQLDLFVAGTIQERAIVYLNFENVLNFKSFIVPYYSVRPFGVRFGISWELFN